MEDEKELIEQVRSGDQRAFETLMERHQGKIYGLTLRMVGNAEDAAELTQETFFNAWKGLKSFQGESSFSTWLYRLASNACIDFLRKEKRRRAISMTLSLDDEEGARQADLPDHRFTPQGELEKKELLGALERGLALLSEEHRSVLVLREINGLTYGEIGEILQLEEGTVKSRIARARLALRKALLADGQFAGHSLSEVT